MMRISMKRVSVVLVKYILKKSELLMIFVILINSHIKDFLLHIHALFLASDFEDFV